MANRILEEKHLVELKVSNLPPTTEPNDVKILFHLFGKVSDVKITKTKGAAEAAVTMSCRSSKRNVILPEGLVFGGNVLEINLVDESNSRTPAKKAKPSQPKRTARQLY